MPTEPKTVYANPAEGPGPDWSGKAKAGPTVEPKPVAKVEPKEVTPTKPTYTTGKRVVGGVEVDTVQGSGTSGYR